MYKLEFWDRKEKQNQYEINSQGVVDTNLGFDSELFSSKLELILKHRNYKTTKSYI